MEMTLSRGDVAEILPQQSDIGFPNRKWCIAISVFVHTANTTKNRGYMLELPNRAIIYSVADLPISLLISVLACLQLMKQQLASNQGVVC
jgi:hypothetical protein